MPKPPSKNTDVVLDREIIYPTRDVRSYSEEDGYPLDVETAMQLLGWVEPEDGDKFDEFMFKDRNGKTIRAMNAERFQRFYYASNAISLMWDILNGNWEFNFETIVIGKTGYVLDGKHRLIALVFAYQEWSENPDLYPRWLEGPPTIDVIVGFGADERKELVNTIGTGKPRSLADSLYASGLFEDESTASVKRLCKMTQHAVRLLWQRTGASSHVQNDKASHSDCLDFIDRHPSILQAVKTIYYEDDENRITQILSRGYAAALLYLMSMSNTSSEEYHKSDNPTEMMCKNGMEEKAEEFWLKIAHREPSVRPVCDKITELSEGGNVNAFDRIAVIVKGWNEYKSKGKVNKSTVQIKTTVDDFGVRHLLEDPIIGGIDLGNDQE